MSRIVDEHREYLADKRRVAAFRRAIEATVRPGDVVLDLASGTGILGLLAASAGATHVYSIESSSLIGLTRQIASANGWRDRFTFLRELSTFAELPEKVDVVVSDQIGRFGFESGVFEYFADARTRLLKPEGTMIPSSVSLWAAPVERADVWADVDFWSRPVHGFDMTPARDISVNTGYPVHLKASHLLGPPVHLISADPGEPVREPWRVSGTSIATRAGTLHGVGGWFSADLAPGVTMTNSPLSHERINRRNVYLPTDQPVPVAAGDQVDIRMQVSPARYMLSWTIEVRGAGAVTPSSCSSHSTWKGMLLRAEDLRRTSPTFVPHLTPRGRARLTVLELCDGQAALGEVQAEVLRRHPDLFPSEAEAGVFVAEVVTRYAT
ncbi:MAG: class I SAM-dependent methyltransferase [Actinomycetota bacterium]|nr:class I SAM-dependent methyltransferase [Actinomycetota bacterium]